MGILAVEHQRDHGLLVGERGRQRHVGAGIDGALEQAQHERRLVRDLFRERERLLHELFGFDHPVGEPERHRFLRPDGRAGEHHLLRPAERDLADQALRAAGAGEEPEIDLGHADLRRRGEHPDVGGQHQFRAAAEGEAVHRRDGGLVQGLDPAEEPMDRRRELFVVGEAPARVEIGDVAAGHERAARAGEHHDPHRFIRLDLAHGIVECAAGRHIKRVQPLRPVDGDDPCPARGLDQHGALAHAPLPFFISLSRRALAPLDRALRAR